MVAPIDSSVPSNSQTLRHTYPWTMLVQLCVHAFFMLRAIELLPD
jgi:hypothetical protein